MPPTPFPGAAAQQHLPANLRALREHQGISRAALARQMHERGHPTWVATTVARVEKGDQVPRHPEVVDLADILGVTVERLSWATGEAAEQMAASHAIGRLRESAEEAAEALVRFYAARAAAERGARDAGKSKYLRVRGIARDIEEELGNAAVQDVLAESSRRWEEIREGRG